MKTIEIKILTFEELTPEAQKVAIENYRENQYFDFVWDDAHATVKEFLEQVPTIKTGRNSWLECNLNNVEDNVRQLKGVRLRTWFINNFSFLYKRKYIKHFDGHKKHRMIRNKTAKHTKKDYCIVTSNINETQECNLTGHCYDMDFLAPIYDFIKTPCKHTNFDEIIDECFNSLKKSIENEIEAMQKDEYIIEEIEENDLEFTEDGKRY
jgi:hypothetical protein